eukprot:TRINITY_DN8135_c0_g1_i1.p1 TRINITY_DN8135_c0_g1~~TRINITY_DN8135_c0_g1_i1.p1  ORF type:complete len:671 (-),score=186.03 TRINITY_DN8135_c0_g1_i1:14-1891(-)
MAEPKTATEIASALASPSLTQEQADSGFLKERVRTLEREIRYKDEQLALVSRKLVAEQEASSTRNKQLTLLREMQQHLEDDVTAKRDECDFLTTRVSSVESEMREQDARMSQLRQQHDQSRQLLEQAQQRDADQQKKIASLNEEMSVLRVRAERSEEIDRLNKELDELRARDQRMDELEAELDAARQRVVDDDNQSLQALSASQRTSKVVDKMKKKLDNERALVAHHQEANAQLRADIARMKSEMAELQAKNGETTERLEKDVQGMLELYQGLEQEHLNVNSQLTWARENSEGLAKDLAALREDADEQRRIAVEQTAQANTLQRQLRGRDKQISFLSEQLRTAEGAARTHMSELQAARDRMASAQEFAEQQGGRAVMLEQQLAALTQDLQDALDTSKRNTEMLALAEEEAQSRAATAEFLSQRVRALDEKLVAKDETIGALRQELQSAFDDMKFMSAKKQAGKVLERLERELAKAKGESQAHREQTTFLNSEIERMAVSHNDAMAAHTATIERLETDVRNVVELHTTAVDEARRLQDTLRGLEEERQYWTATGERRGTATGAVTELKRELREVQRHYFNHLLQAAMRTYPDALPVDDQMLFERVIASALPYKDWGSYIKRYVEPL